MRRTSVLVTDGHNRASLAVVRALGRDFDVAVLSKNRFSIASASRYCRQHFVASPSVPLARQVAALCEKHGFQFVVATLEDTVIELAKNANRTGKANYTVPEFGILNLALDKSETIRIAQQANVPVPQTIDVENFGAIMEAADKIGFPVVIKPRRSISFYDGKRITNRGPRYASNRAELETLVRELPDHLEPPLVQKFIPGTGVGAFFLIDGNGESIAEFAHRRIRDINPTGSGSTFRESVAIDPEVREHSLRLLRAMNWRGVAMVEFRRSSIDQSLTLMEVNGRFWGSLDLAFQAGVNFPKRLVESYGSNASSPNIASYRVGKRVRWLLGDMLRFARILRGRPTGFPGAYPSRMQGVAELFDLRNVTCGYEVLRITDPLPFVAEACSIFRS